MDNYQRFVPNFAQKAHPLTEATKQSAPNILLRGMILCMMLFMNYIIAILCNVSCLHIPSPQDEFSLHTDASEKELGQY